jgi:PST family polysaccharide transporter
MLHLIQRPIQPWETRRLQDDVIADPHDPTMLKRRSVRGAVATFIGQGTRFLLQLLSQVMLARLLLPAEFGLVAMIGPVLSFVGIFNELGLSQATVQRPNITHQELSNLFWINVAVSAALALLMCGAAPLIALFYGDPRLTVITMWLATLLVVAGLSAQQLALMNRHMRFGQLATIDVACTFMAVAVGVISAWFGMGYWSLVLMQAANGLTILVMAWAWSNWLPSLPKRGVGTLSLLHFGSHMTGYNLINFAGANLDSVMIGKLGGSVALGLYDRAFKLVAAPMWTISLPVARVADSLLARLQGTAERYRRAFLLMLQAVLLITVPAVAFTAAMAPALVRFLLGPAWEAAAPIVAWLAVATAFAPLSLSASWLFVSQNRPAEQTRFACLRTGVAVLALLAGLHWGAVGVARSYAVFGLLVHGLPLWGATRRGPVQLRDVAGIGCPIAIGGAIAMLVVSLFDHRMQQAGIPLSLRLIGGASLSYISCVCALMCLPNGLRLLRDMWLLRSIFQPNSATAQIKPQASGG